MAPPAGPDSTRRMGKRWAVPMVVRPPPDSMRKTGAWRPMAWRPDLEAAEVAGDEGLDVGVGGGGAEALPLAHLGGDFAGEADGEVPGRAAARMSRVRRSWAGLAKLWRKPMARLSTSLALEGGDEGVDGVFVEREEDFAEVVEAFGDGEAEVAGDKGLGEGDAEVVLVVAALVAEGEDVAEALGGDERGAGALAFDDGVGGEGGAVDEDFDVGGGEVGLG